MIQKLFKAALVLASSAVVIPYAVALITNVIYGWPIHRDKYRRALNPRKVFALNYALLLELKKVRFAGLFWRWQRFYRLASKEILIKNIPFGSNGNFLDVYLARQSTSEAGGKRPVVVFLYGGTWGSGDKSMYGLLCSHLSEQLKAVVVCPNYSIFPKGFVDDMVQDIGEVIQWVRQHAESFGGNKDEIILLGHSAGAHLAALTCLELCIKRLVRDDESIIMSTEEAAASSMSKGESLELSFIGLNSTSSTFYFDDKHFNSNERYEGHGDGNGGQNQAVGASFMMGPGAQGDSMVMESFYIVDKPEEDATEKDLKEHVLDKPQEDAAEKDLKEHVLEESSEKETVEERVISQQKSATKQEETEVTKFEDDDLLSSIKLVIGLAGVYNIPEHFQFESWRGVEDISTMARAMYDQWHFEQFSPTILAKALPLNIRLPPFHLLHGDADYTVPFSSSVSFGEALWSRGVRSVQVVILPGCGHHDICLDLMETGRLWHNVILAEIGRSIHSAI